MIKTRLELAVVALFCVVSVACDTGGGDSSAQNSSTLFDDQIEAHKAAQELEGELQKAAERRAEQMP